MKKMNIIFISGTWCTHQFWGDFPQRMGEDLNSLIYVPNPKHHELSYEECGEKIASVGLDDYAEHLCTYIENQIDSTIPTILIGHSLGGLIAQLVASKVTVDGLILLGSAPAHGMFGLYPTMIKIFGPYFLRWGFWKKPMHPSFSGMSYIMSQEDLTTKKKIFNDLVPDSGKAYTQMGFWFLDPKCRAKVDYQKITCPVLVITGTEDKAVNPRISRITAKKYQQSKLIKIEGADHMYHLGGSSEVLFMHLSNWLKENFSCI